MQARKRECDARDRLSFWQQVSSRSSFQDKIESHISGLGCKIKKVGNDFEIHHEDERIAQVMFREDYIGIKKEGNKFPKEFEYTELGKIKSEITLITIGMACVCSHETQ